MREIDGAVIFWKKSPPQFKIVHLAKEYEELGEQLVRMVELVEQLLEWMEQRPGPTEVGKVRPLLENEKQKKWIV